MFGAQSCNYFKLYIFTDWSVTSPVQFKTVVFSNSLPNKKILPNFLNTCFSFQRPVSERLVWHGWEFRWSQNQIRRCNWFMCVSSGILSGSWRDRGVQGGGWTASWHSLHHLAGLWITVEDHKVWPTAKQIQNTLHAQHNRLSRKAMSLGSTWWHVGAPSSSWPQTQQCVYEILRKSFPVSLCDVFSPCMVGRHTRRGAVWEF